MRLLIQGLSLHGDFKRKSRRQRSTHKGLRLAATTSLRAPKIPLTDHDDRALSDNYCLFLESADDSQERSWCCVWRNNKKERSAGADVAGTIIVFSSMRNESLASVLLQKISCECLIYMNYCQLELPRRPQLCSRLRHHTNLDYRISHAR